MRVLREAASEAFYQDGLAHDAHHSVLTVHALSVPVARKLYLVCTLLSKTWLMF